MVTRNNNDQTAATREDLRFLSEELRDAMRDGFRGVHERQDRTNGRVGKTEMELAVMVERVLTLGNNIKTLFGMMNRRQSPRFEGDPGEEGMETAYPKQQRYPNKVVVPGVAAASIAAFEALQRIVPAIIEAMQSWPR
jgi:hypothetical protein